MKKTLYFLLLLFVIQSNAQHVRAYAGISAFLHSDFQNNSFTEFGAGVEVKAHRYFRPEIGVSYFTGNLEDYSNVDALGNVVNRSQKKASALNYNFTPKITLCAKEVSAGDTFIQILPRFNVSKIEAERYYTVYNQSNPALSVTKKETLTEWQSSFGIGAGIDIVLSDKNYNSLSINVYYNGVDLGKALTEINNSSTKYNTDTVGMGINFYLGFERKKD